MSEWKLSGGWGQPEAMASSSQWSKATEQKHIFFYLFIFFAAQVLKAFEAPVSEHAILDVTFRVTGLVDFMFYPYSHLSALTSVIKKFRKIRRCSFHKSKEKEMERIWNPAQNLIALYVISLFIVAA